MGLSREERALQQQLRLIDRVHQAQERRFRETERRLSATDKLRNERKQGLTHVPVVKVDSRDPGKLFEAICKHRKLAEEHGAIVLRTPATGMATPYLQRSKLLSVRKQQLVLRERKENGTVVMIDNLSGHCRRSVPEVRERTRLFKSRRLHLRDAESGDSLSDEELESIYWSWLRNAQLSSSSIEYASDIEANISSHWPGGGLSQLAIHPDSLMAYMGEDIPGVSSPMTYVGTTFSTFAWHYEDNHLTAVNYSHAGDTKTWYVIPAEDAGLFEKLVYEQLVPSWARKRPDLLMQKVVLAEPSLIRKNGIRVKVIRQKPGDMVVTGPRCFHSGFSHGFTLGEAVNLAPVTWLPAGVSSTQSLREVRRTQVLNMERLILAGAGMLQREFSSNPSLCSSNDDVDENLAYHEQVAMPTQLVQNSSRPYAGLLCRWMHACKATCSQAGLTVSDVPASEIASARKVCTVCKQVSYAIWAQANIAKPSDEQPASLPKFTCQSDPQPGASCGSNMVACMQHLPWLVIQTILTGTEPPLVFARQLQPLSSHSDSDYAQRDLAPMLPVMPVSVPCPNGQESISSAVQMAQTKIEASAKCASSHCITADHSQFVLSTRDQLPKPFHVLADLPAYPFSQPRLGLSDAKKLIVQFARCGIPVGSVHPSLVLPQSAFFLPIFGKDTPEQVGHAAAGQLRSRNSCIDASPSKQGSPPEKRLRPLIV